MNHVLIYAIYRTEAWWTYVGSHMGFDQVTVLTDKRGRGDRWVTDDFYAAYRQFKASGARSSDLVTEAEMTDLVARCRVLRWMPPAKAAAMVLGMAFAMEKALSEIAPDAIVSLPIDSYVSDLLERRARARGIPYFELTTSALPGMSMLLYRGKLVTTVATPEPEEVKARISEIAAPGFAPVYVQKAKVFSRTKFYRTQAYFRTRAAFFKLYSWLTRDPLSLHFLDAQPFLGHKARLSDVRIVDMVDHDWLDQLEKFPRDRRVLFGLQMFPEAAIDYWIEDLRLIRQEDMLLDLAERLSAAGYQVVVKDHPLQFGFRQTGLLDAMRAIPNAVIVPYDVSGNVMLAECGVSVTATGTLGLQAALLGNASVAGEAYYVVEDDFVVIRDWDSLADVSNQLALATAPERLEERQGRIVEQLLRGSFAGPFMCLFGFKSHSPGVEPGIMGRELGAHLRRVGPGGENWHGRNLRVDGGKHAGSPLNAPTSGPLVASPAP